MVYVHSKMMIVDDNTVIIGSGIVYKYVPCPLYEIVPRSVKRRYRLMKTCSARSKRRDHFFWLSWDKRSTNPLYTYHGE